MNKNTFLKQHSNLTKKIEWFKLQLTLLEDMGDKFKKSKTYFTECAKYRAQLIKYEKLQHTLINYYNATHRVKLLIAENNIPIT